MMGGMTARNTLISAPGRLARSLLPFPRRPQTILNELPAFAVAADAIDELPDPVMFRQTLLQLIGQATRRIVLVALYLQDDDAGRELLDALYAAKARAPDLQVSVFVDWHRARRGLIGKTRSEGNAGMYRAYAERLGDGVVIHGVPVQNRELFGVLHLKGFVIDDALLYSGASINDVYLARHGRYRLDRYHLLRHAPLADAMADFLQQQDRFVDFGLQLGVLAVAVLVAGDDRFAQRATPEFDMRREVIDRAVEQEGAQAAVMRHGVLALAAD